MNKYQEVLEIGTIYKSYRQVCEVLDEPIQAGNSKKSQIREWESHFGYQKQGNKFIITEIYDTPKAKVDGRGNKVVYVELIERLILEMLNESDGYKTVISKGKILERLKMVNSNYSRYKYDKKTLCESMGISKEELEDFYSSSDTMLNSNVQSALDNLRDKSLAHSKEVMFISVASSLVEFNELDELKINVMESVNEYGDVKRDLLTNTDVKTEHRLATDKEVSNVLQAQSETLTAFNCKSLGDVYKKGLHSTFYASVNKELTERFNIISYYYGYEIVFTESGVKNKLELLNATIEGKRDDEQKLKDGVKERTFNNMMVKHNKVNKDKYSFRDDENYLENGYKLIEKLMD